MTRISKKQLSMILDSIGSAWIAYGRADEHGAASETVGYMARAIAAIVRDSQPEEYEIPEVVP